MEMTNKEHSVLVEALNQRLMFITTRLNHEEGNLERVKENFQPTNEEANEVAIEVSSLIEQYNEEIEALETLLDRIDEEVEIIDE